MAVVIANSTTSTTTGWPVGFWWSELTHSYYLLSALGFMATPRCAALVENTRRVADIDVDAEVLFDVGKPGDGSASGQMLPFDRRAYLRIATPWQMESGQQQRPWRSFEVPPYLLLPSLGPAALKLFMTLHALKSISRT